HSYKKYSQRCTPRELYRATMDCGGLLNFFLAVLNLAKELQVMKATKIIESCSTKLEIEEYIETLINTGNNEVI
ncbi:MAG: hypothetical protein ACRC5M_05145, partial [Anaeroplasmataceae bacterium]